MLSYDMDGYSGHIAALATACCWTVTSMAFESAGKRVGSLSVNLIRLCMAFVFLSVFCLFSRGRLLPTDADSSAWLWLSVSGVVGFSIGDLFLFRAFVVIGSRISSLIMSLAPPLTALIGWVLMGEKLALLHWIGMAVTISGVCWVVLERPSKTNGFKSKGIPFYGIVFAFIGAVGQAAGLVLSKFGMQDYDPFAATQIRVIAGVAGFSFLFSVSRWWPRTFKALKNRPAMIRTGLGSFFGPFLGVSLSLVAVKYVETGIAAIIMSIVPVLIILPSVVILKEVVSMRAVLGAIVAVAGVALLFV